MGKKIGIVTIWDSQDNYGQVLQCYALQRYLIKHGHNAYLIKTVSDTLASTSKIQRIFGLPKKMFQYRFWSLLYFRYKLRVFNKRHGMVNRHFDEFRNRYIKSTSEIYNIEELKKRPPMADIYITGSDQVWGASSDLYFLNFVPDGKPRYSYAASFGSNPFTDKGCKKMKSLLEKFKEVTVREDSGIEKCQRMGIQAERIIDPTGLLTRADYKSIADVPVSGKYIFLYLLGNFTDVNVKSIFKFAKVNRLAVKYVASQGRNDKFEKCFPSPTEWIGLIANAEYVVTNSYHCCMFSMYFQKKFMALNLTGIFRKMNVRMDTLFQSYNIPRIKRLEDLVSTSFDYASITESLENDRNNAEQILKNWLKE